MSVYEAIELMINFGILLLAILTFQRKK
ncbi:TPA: putative holin-like toxin [Streptococcus suis]|nr:putative holin-like toxin [Streptococcus suis]MBY4970204.1 putative holin-like toxin [Streptococcus suis]MBY4981152.1 putative holin-like toxin [Streptococcus suis]MBY4991860.1 putative holin-like toxin [Streptococcus suis]MBY5001189.1 putative holin-like toxin [Streptococcus suis]